MKYTVDKSKRPVYLQIYKQMKEDIVSGAYSYGNKLPSKRFLASEIGVSSITVEHAYGLLCEEGYAEARERSGYIVIFRQTDGFAASKEFKTQSAPVGEKRNHGRLSGIFGLGIQQDNEKSSERLSGCYF